MTPEQAAELEKNLDRILEKTLPEKAKRGRSDDVKKLFETDKRFRFLDQIRGARDKIRDAFRKSGCK